MPVTVSQLNLEPLSYMDSDLGRARHEAAIEATSRELVEDANRVKQSFLADSLAVVYGAAAATLAAALATAKREHALTRAHMRSDVFRLEAQLRKVRAELALLSSLGMLERSSTELGSPRLTLASPRMEDSSAEMAASSSARQLRFPDDEESAVRPPESLDAALSLRRSAFETETLRDERAAGERSDLVAQEAMSRLDISLAEHHAYGVDIAQEARDARVCEHAFHVRAALREAATCDAAKHVLCAEAEMDHRTIVAGEEHEREMLVHGAQVERAAAERNGRVREELQRAGAVEVAVKTLVLTEAATSEGLRIEETHGRCQLTRRAQLELDARDAVTAAASRMDRDLQSAVSREAVAVDEIVAQRTLLLEESYERQTLLGRALQDRRCISASDEAALRMIREHSAELAAAATSIARALKQRADDARRIARSHGSIVDEESFSRASIVLSASGGSTALRELQKRAIAVRLVCLDRTEADRRQEHERTAEQTSSMLHAETTASAAALRSQLWAHLQATQSVAAARDNAERFAAVMRDREQWFAQASRTHERMKSELLVARFVDHAAQRLGQHCERLRAESAEALAAALDDAVAANAADVEARLATEREAAARRRSDFELEHAALLADRIEQAVAAERAQWAQREAQHRTEAEARVRHAVAAAVATERAAKEHALGLSERQAELLAALAAADVEANRARLIERMDLHAQQTVVEIDQARAAHDEAWAEERETLHAALGSLQDEALARCRLQSEQRGAVACVELELTAGIQLAEALALARAEAKAQLDADVRTAQGRAAEEQRSAVEQALAAQRRLFDARHADIAVAAAATLEASVQGAAACERAVSQLTDEEADARAATEREACVEAARCHVRCAGIAATASRTHALATAVEAAVRAACVAERGRLNLEHDEQVARDAQLVAWRTEVAVLELRLCDLRSQQAAAPMRAAAAEVEVTAARDAERARLLALRAATEQHERLALQVSVEVAQRDERERMLAVTSLAAQEAEAATGLCVAEARAASAIFAQHALRVGAAAAAQRRAAEVDEAQLAATTRSVDSGASSPTSEKTSSSPSASRDRRGARGASTIDAELARLRFLQCARHEWVVEKLRESEDRAALMAGFQHCKNLPGLWHLRAAVWTIPEVRTLAFDSANSRIIKIDISGQHLEGRVLLEHLPPLLEWLDISSNQLQGALTLTCLPKVLKYFYVYANKFDGALDASQLPRCLVHFFAYQNHFSGALHLSALPATLEDFNVNTNKLSGPLDLTSLPLSLTHLNVGCNLFAGPVSFAKLPPRLSKLSLHSNALSGTVDLSALPRTMTHFDAFANQFNGVIMLMDLPRTLTRLYLQDNKFEGLLDWSRMPPAMVHFDIASNHFSGVVMLNRLPPTLASLTISGNDFGGGLDLSQVPPSLKSVDASCNHFTKLVAMPPSTLTTLATLILHSNAFVGEVNVAALPVMHELDLRWCPHVKLQLAAPCASQPPASAVGGAANGGEEPDATVRTGNPPSWIKV